jgi:voltage-dependent anion channel protein 2
VKTKTPSGVTFKVEGTRDWKSSVFPASLEAKYADYKKGITFTQSWNTANALRAQLELENQFAKGLKLDVSGSLVPDKGAGTKSALVSALYKQPGLHTRAFLDVFRVCSPRNLPRR